MFNPFPFVVAYRMLENRREAAIRVAEPPRERSFLAAAGFMVWNIALLSAAFLLLLSVTFGVMYSASWALVRPGPDDVYFGCTRYGLFVPAMLLTMWTYSILSDYLKICWNGEKRERKTVLFKLFAGRVLARRQKRSGIIIATVLSVLGVIFATSHVAVTANSIAIHNGFYRTVYPFTAIRSLNFYRNFEDSEGRVTRAPTCDIHFQDGYVWFSNGWDLVVNYSEAKAMVEYISKQSGIRFQVHELHKRGS